MPRSVRIFVAAVVGAALGCLLVLAVVLPPGSNPTSLRDWLAFGTFVLLAVLLQSLSAAIFTSSGVRASSSVAAIPYLAMVPLFGPLTAAMGSAVAEGAVSLFIRRLPKIKAAFNVAQLVIGLSLAGLAYSLLGGPVTSGAITLTTRTVLAFAAAASVFFGVNSILVTAVVALDSSEPFRRTWNLVTAGLWPGDLAGGTLALVLTLLYAKLHLFGVLALLLPLSFVHHTNQINVRLHQLNRDLLRLIVKTIEAKDPYTSGHSVRVARLSRRIAEEMRLPPRMVETVETAALLHDFGKIDIAYGEIISQPGPLTTHQRSLIRSHPVRGAELLGSISSLDRQITEAVRHHHEHFDGTGYPDGLVAETIPLAARIIMVADTVDAMLSVRAYRPALPLRAVEDELRRLKGKQFDPGVADALLSSGVLEAYSLGKAREPSTQRPLILSSRQHVERQESLDRIHG